LGGSWGWIIDVGASTNYPREPAWRKEENSWIALAHTILNYVEKIFAPSFEGRHSKPGALVL
jgi:hypothetical protein